MMHTRILYGFRANVSRCAGRTAQRQYVGKNFPVDRITIYRRFASIPTARQICGQDQKAPGL